MLNHSECLNNELNECVWMHVVYILPLGSVFDTRSDFGHFIHMNAWNSTSCTFIVLVNPLLYKIKQHERKVRKEPEDANKNWTGKWEWNKLWGCDISFLNLNVFWCFIFQMHVLLSTTKTRGVTVCMFIHYNFLHKYSEVPLQVTMIFYFTNVLMIVDIFFISSYMLHYKISVST